MEYYPGNRRPPFGPTPQGTYVIPRQTWILIICLYNIVNLFWFFLLLLAFTQFEKKYRLITMYIICKVCANMQKLNPFWIHYHNALPLYSTIRMHSPLFSTFDNCTLPKIHYIMVIASNFTDIDRITSVTLTLLVRTPQDLSLALVTKDFRAGMICFIRE